MKSERPYANTAVAGATGEALAWTASDAIIIVDDKGCIVACSGLVEVLLGYPRGEVVGAEVQALLRRAKVDVDAATSLLQPSADAGDTSGPGRTLATRAIRSDGQALDIGLSVTSVELAGLRYEVIVLRDIGEQTPLRAAVPKSEDRVSLLERKLDQIAENFQTVVQDTYSGILIVSETGTIRFANPIAARILGQPVRSLVGQEFGIPSVNGLTEIDFTYPDRTVGTAEMRSAETSWRGAPAHLIMLNDITERKRAEECGEHAADHDPLTGLENRAVFLGRLNDALRRRRRNGDHLALLLIAVDRFKALDARLGHAVGDAVLRAAARRISRALRAADKVARVGGEEFAVIMEGLSAPADARPVVERIQRAIAMPIDVVSSTLSISVSVGVAIAPDDGDDAALLLRHSENAMSARKRTAWTRSQSDSN